MALPPRKSARHLRRRARQRVGQISKNLDDGSRRRGREGECHGASKKLQPAAVANADQNQGSRDTCYAFAFTAGLEVAYKHKYGKVIDGKYQGQEWILSEEFLIRIAKSTLLNVPQNYLFENPSSYLSGVIGVAGDPMMISVLSEQLMHYRIPESRYAPNLSLDNSKTPNSLPGLTQFAAANNCSILMALDKKWISAAPKLNNAGQCTAGNCATQQAADARDYAPNYIPSTASSNARFGVSFDYKAPDGAEQPGAKALSKAQMSDTDLMESMLFEGHEIVSRVVSRLEKRRRDQGSTSDVATMDLRRDRQGWGPQYVAGRIRSLRSVAEQLVFHYEEFLSGDKYYFVSYSFIQKATRAAVS